MNTHTTARSLTASVMLVVAGALAAGGLATAPPAAAASKYVAIAFASDLRLRLRPQSADPGRRTRPGTDRMFESGWQSLRYSDLGPKLVCGAGRQGRELLRVARPYSAGGRTGSAAAQRGRGHRRVSLRELTEPTVGRRAQTMEAAVGSVGARKLDAGRLCPCRFLATFSRNDVKRQVDPRRDASRSEHIAVIDDARFGPDIDP
jgi:hypothetical protein